MPSSWRSEQSLEAYLQHWQIPGIQGIDTRALDASPARARCDESVPNDRAAFGEQAVAEAIRARA